MYPVKDLQHVAEAVALLTDHYRNKTIIPGLVKSFARQVQFAENAAFDVIEKFFLANNPVGNQLDALGSIVGVGRAGSNDVDYLAEIKLQIRVNRSQGLSEDVIQVMVLAGGTKPVYLDTPPPWSGSFLVESWNLPSPLIVARQLKRCRSVATYGELHYTVWPDGNDFTFVSRNVTLPGELGFGSRETPTVGGLLVAAEAI